MTSQNPSLRPSFEILRLHCTLPHHHSHSTPHKQQYHNTAHYPRRSITPDLHSKHPTITMSLLLPIGFPKGLSGTRCLVEKIGFLLLCLDLMIPVIVRTVMFIFSNGYSEKPWPTTPCTLVVAFMVYLLIRLCVATAKHYLRYPKKNWNRLSEWDRS